MTVAASWLPSCDAKVVLCQLSRKLQRQENRIPPFRKERERMGHPLLGFAQFNQRIDRAILRHQTNFDELYQSPDRGRAIRANLMDLTHGCSESSSIWAGKNTRLSIGTDSRAASMPYVWSSRAADGGKSGLVRIKTESRFAATSCSGVNAPASALSILP